MQLTLLNNKTLPITEDGLVNIRDLAKEMYSGGNDSKALRDFYNGELFISLNEKLTSQLPFGSSSKITEKLPTDRVYPSLVCKELLQGFLMDSQSKLANKWKEHLIFVILPEYERLHAKEFKEVIDQQDFLIHQQDEQLEEVQEALDIQELIRTRNVIDLLEAFDYNQQAVCDLLRDTPDYEAGGYVSPTTYAKHHNITIELARFTIAALSEPIVCPCSRNDGMGMQKWKSILRDQVPARNLAMSGPYRPKPGRKRRGRSPLSNIGPSGRLS